MEFTKIVRLINKNKKVLSKNYKVKSIGIFGSFVRNEQREDSDIDILVEFSEPIGLKFFTLENSLSEILGMKVDLVTKGALKPIIREDILKEVIEI
ncbi:nucleotidyltransferase family protein [candidate division WOR-3 bacterium]|nr:nucleotidyltransferase family protein [candidate division WOR-3 bacterium]